MQPQQAGWRWSLGAAPAGAPITAGLAGALRDPGLELRMRLPGAAWTDEAGRAAPEPQAGDRGRAITRSVLGDGTEVALLHDPAAIADRAAAESAVAVTATAVDNARHERQVHARIEHLRRLRRGLLEAADEERRALEDELRLGPLREADRLHRTARYATRRAGLAIATRARGRRRRADRDRTGAVPAGTRP